MTVTGGFLFDHCIRILKEQNLRDDKFWAPFGSPGCVRTRKRSCRWIAICKPLKNFDPDSKRF